MKGEGAPLLVVRASELAEAMRPWVERERVKAKDAKAASSHGFRPNPMAHRMGPMKWLSQETGLDESRVSRIYRCAHKFVNLDIAEKLLIAIGEQHAVHDGRIHILPNPAMKRATWRERMKAQGVRRPEDVLT